MNKARLIEHAAALVNEKKIEGISDIRDESDRDGMRIVFELKRGEQAEVVLNNLYKHTQLQISFGVIMLSIVNGQPRELGLIDCIKRFIDHRVDVVRRRTDYQLRKAREREHILLGFQKALDNLDEVIRLIRAAKTPREAREGLIAALRVHRAAGAGHHRTATAAPHRHGAAEDPRRTGRHPAPHRRVPGNSGLRESAARRHRQGAEGSPEGLRRRAPHRRSSRTPARSGWKTWSQVEDVAVTVTHGGYLKRTAVDTYRRQTRGGKGRIGMGTRAEDVVEHLIIASTHSYLLIFTNKGRVYWLKIYEIPDAAHHRQGQAHLQPDQPAAGRRR